MAEFWIDLPAAREAAGELAESANALEAEIAEIAGAANGVLSCLSDASATGISEQLRGLSEELAQQKRNIEAMASVLFSICDVYESTENEVAAQGRQCMAESVKIVDGDANAVFAEETFEAIPAVFYGAGPKQNDATIDKASFFPTTDQWDKMMRSNPSVVENQNKALRYKLKKDLPPFYIRGLDGSVNYDWYEIKSILKKDADQITPEEYYDLALLLAYMGDEDTATFLKCMLTKNKDISQHDSWTAYHRPNEYSEWSIDAKKCRVLQKIIIDHSDMYDSNSIDWEDVVNNWDEKESPLDEYALLDYAGELDKKHDGLLAKASLLGACEMIGTETSRKHNLGRGKLLPNEDSGFTADKDAKEPDISVTTREDGSIELKFNCTKSSTAHGFGRGRLGGTTYYHLSEETITIARKTENDAIDDLGTYLYDNYSPNPEKVAYSTFKNLLIGAGTGLAEGNAFTLFAVGAAQSVAGDMLGDDQSQTFDRLFDEKTGLYKHIVSIGTYDDFGMKTFTVSNSKGEGMTMVYQTASTEGILERFGKVLKQNGIDPRSNFDLPGNITVDTIVANPEGVKTLLGDSRISPKERDYVTNEFFSDYLKDLINGKTS